MKNQKSTRRQQRGFTLVEMSVTMAAAGLLFAAVTTGQELIDQSKAQKLLNDVKTVEAQLQQYAQLKGRLPGDCNADGVIDYAADVTSRLDTDNSSRAGAYSYSVKLPTTPADAAQALAQTDGCALAGVEAPVSAADPESNTPAQPNANADTNANVWLNDLKLAGVISDSAPNRSLAKMVNEDFMFVGNVTDSGAQAAELANYNAIVIHNVPQWMARRLATAINGQDARADRTRVRLLDRLENDGTYSSLWSTNQEDMSGTTATRDGMVSVVYFFDRIPESKMGG